METASPFLSPLSEHVWQSKYRLRAPGGGDAAIEDTWQRVARALAEVEGGAAAHWRREFLGALADFRFLPGGRILAGAGSGRRVTLFNCFVMGPVPDSLEGILDALKEGALTMQQGGGVGYDFSTLRPHGTHAASAGTIASGPVSFMRIWDSTCATLLSTGARRGAMMATLRCDHPDIERFVDAKRDARELRHFNVSVLVTDAFMQAVEHDEPWPLVFPSASLDVDAGASPAEEVVREWPGSAGAVPCRVLARVRARELWARIMHAAYDCAEPGVLFVDRINETNNLRYRERISATNPCGEIPLPPYGACNLGSVNLTRFVLEPFTARARIDGAALAATVATATRMLDDVIDCSRFPLAPQAEQARGARRVGLGITGLADCLLMLGLDYDGDAGRERAAGIMRDICHTAYRTSSELAEEKGSFPFYVRERYLDAPFVAALPAEIRDGIARRGMRNSHLTAIAPAGTISLLANAVSNGIEPIYAARHRRAVLQGDGTRRTFEVEDYACAAWRRLHGDDGLPPAFADAETISPRAHLAMQAALQPFVDNAISKTVNVPGNLGFDAFESLYREAYALGLKGCTAFRPNPVTGAVLSVDQSAEASSHCCSVEREAD